MTVHLQQNPIRSYNNQITPTTQALWYIKQNIPQQTHHLKQENWSIAFNVTSVNTKSREGNLNWDNLSKQYFHICIMD